MRKKRELFFGIAAAMVFAASMSVYAEQEEETQGDTQMQTESLVASADEMAAPVDVVEADMEAVYGDEVKDGVYTIDVSSSSSMFKITDCSLTVDEEEMTAVITLGGDGYLKLFMGTGEEAVKASEDEYITFTENEEGFQTYEVPVEALDMGIDCAAWSKRKEKWYDRVLVFEASSLPQDALLHTEMTQPEDLALEDGSYTIEVVLEGGSGRTAVQSPAVLTVEDGVLTAEIVWGSPYYDYMIVGEEKYLPVNTEGDAVFEIPVTGLDYKMPVTADTIAMSQPHEIDYTLYFDSVSITALDE
ncbi:MAG TPA: hypothetical protein IAB97_08560 [Candidatus Choladousia intestinipullorum]|nr:hypothetical protein [Candidatus Choladousia intestinipullorum]